VAIDNFSDTIHSDEKRSWAPFDFCREALGYQPIQCWHEEMSVYDIAPLGQFDLTLFLACLYHCRHPLLALERLHVALKPGGLLCVESHICDDYSPYKEGGLGDLPLMEFYPDDQLVGNPTNWWGPTLRALACMMRVAGFKDVRSWKIGNPTDLAHCRGYAQGVKA